MEIHFKKKKFLVAPTNYQNFWNNFSNWEQNDLDFFSQIAEENKIFIDIGAWIGPYTLIAASMGMKVYAFEPDKVAFQELKKNIKLNNFKHKPEIFNFGLSKTDSKAYLYSNTNDFGKSESGLINYKNQKNTKQTEIELKNFLQEIYKIKNYNLNYSIKVIKIDIEGGEFLFEKDIYDLVNLEKIYCIFSYHYMVFNRNKFKKNFYKMRTLFYQIFVNKIYPSDNFFRIANIFKSR